MLSPSPPAGDVVRPYSPRLRMTAAARTSTILAASAWLAATVAAQTLPYIPTSIFVPAPKPGQTRGGATEELAYIFSPRDNSVDLLALDISATLRASSLSLKTLSSSLPFLESSSTAFVPSLADNGSLLVYAGDCSTSNDSGLWSFDPSTPSASSTLWTQEDIKLADDADWVQMGPGFLGAGFSFSTVIEPKTSPANTFVYGGMCPHSGSYPTSSQSEAEYSNQMVKISPSTAGSKGYTVQPVESSGPPIPEAGFTFTSLSPSFSNRSGIITQQIDYVLLGGHTQYAFINMSTVAVWSLPQESWSFVSDISMAGSDPPSTELAIQETIDSVDSRSGHTAVLNEDGTALVILGGWVGDLTQAAFPQLAILRIGSDYGNDGEWQWSIPSSQPSGNGMYGHGAALLPGNVMMVYGGYAISSGGGNNKRQASSSTASFLNLTSMTWSSSYTNPSYTAGSAEGGTAGGNGDQKQKLGLGLGLGLGLALFFFLAVIGFFFYRKRKFQRRTVRDSTIRALAQDNSRFLGHDDLTAELDRDNNWYMGGPDPYARGDRSLGYQSLQTGRASMENSRHNWFGDIGPPPPQMTQINRKPIAPRAARGQHQPSPSSGGYEQVANPRGPGGMNPIFEDDEDDTGDIGEEAISPVRGDGRRDSGAYSDPFLTPTRERPLSFPATSRSMQTPSPEERKRLSVTDPEVQDWMTDIDAADALLSGRIASPRATTAATTAAATTTGPGRISPSRRGLNGTADEDGSRTESNISESNRSNLSRSGSLLRQLRPGFGVAVAAALAATTEGRGGSSSSSSAPSYDTARSNFPALQAEGPGLLLGRDRERERDRDREREREREDGPEDEPQEPGSPSKNKPRRSWLGSLRRVFSNPSTDSVGPPGEADENSPLQSGVVEANDFEARLGSLGGIGGIAADGLLRRKGGRDAWESDEAGPSQGAARYTSARGRGEGARPDDEEWDIEKAVERRLVQVMFTVPKEPLRIVNGEPDFASERDVAIGDPDGEEERRDPAERRWAAAAAAEEEEEQPGRDPLTTGGLGALPRAALTPSPFGDEAGRRSDGSQEDAEKEAIRRELDAEWERIEAEEAVVPEAPPRTPRRRPSPPPPPPPRASEHDILRRPPLLLHRPPPPPTPTDLDRDADADLASLLTIEEQIDQLGAELHQARSATQTPMSIASHHSEGAVLSAEAIRYERPPTGSTSTLQITPFLTPPALRLDTAASRGDPRRHHQHHHHHHQQQQQQQQQEQQQQQQQQRRDRRTDFRSESNLRGDELRRSIGAGGGGGSTSPVRRVRAMVQEFESKSSREASPAGSSASSPVKGPASPTKGPASPSPSLVRPARLRGGRRPVSGGGEDDGAAGGAAL